MANVLGEVRADGEALFASRNVTLSEPGDWFIDPSQPMSYPPPVALLLDYRPCFQMSGILEDNMDKDTIIGRNMNMTCALYIVMFLAVKLTT